ncbi:MAG: TonB-dependent receptor domain-containing protein [Thermoanaerobaculia bacterium]
MPRREHTSVREPSQMSFAPRWARSLRAIFAALCLGAPATLVAQATGTTTGDIRGFVRDESGSPMVGAEVSAVNRATQAKRSDSSRTDGAFAVRLLAPGRYRMTVSMAGWEPVPAEEVAVTVGATTYVDLRVIPRVAESVAVTAQPQLIDRSATDVSETIGQRRILDLPINQRNFLDFALTTPGVTPDRGPQTGAITTSGFSINGQNPRYNNVVIDGVDNNDPASGSVRGTLSQDAVREYQVIRAPFAAEYGRAVGGIVNIVTRSGTNDLHGSAFLFFRDESLSEDNLLTGTRTPYNQTQYGAVLGGPLRPDKLFFFLATERLDVEDANVIAIGDQTIGDQTVAVIRSAGFELENGVVPFERDRQSVLLKLDAAPGASHSLSAKATYSSENDENQQPWGGLVARSGGGARDLRDASLAASAISVLSAGVANEARVLWSDRRHRLDSLDRDGGPSVNVIGFATFGNQRLLPQPRDTQTWQLFDAVSLTRANTTYKAGIDFVHSEIEGSLPAYFAGYYEFYPLSGDVSALDAFAAGIPAVFVQGFGDPHSEVDTTALSAFGQGEWSFRNLLVRLGLRYDLEKPADPFPTDSDNWAPRASFSWSPAKAWRVRGGVGRFYGPTSAGPLFAVGVLDGEQVQVHVRTILGGPSPHEPWGLPGRRFASEAQAGESGVPLSVFRRGSFESASADLASLGVETDILGQVLASLDYLRVRGRHILVERNVNPIVSPAGRIDPAYSEIFRYESTGNSWYEGVTLGLRTRSGGSLELAAFYTYADAEDDHIDFAEGQPQDPLDPASERGPSIHVPEHRTTVSAIFSPEATAPVWLKHWTLALIAEHSVGRPYNELAGFDRNQNGDGGSDRPEGVGRNAGRLPDLFQVDLRVARRFPLGRLELEGVAEVFNLFNRENVLEVNSIRFASSDGAPNPDFGRPTRLADPRRLQLGIRLSF